MLRPVFRLLFLPVRLAFALGRVAGWSRLSVLLIGIGIGLLLAPGPGADLRAKLQAKLDELRAAPAPS